jgi:predicted transcriptional regulator
MTSKRDRIGIMHDILEVIMNKGDKVKPTLIMYKANLSHQMLLDYIKELLEKQLINENTDKQGKRTYSLTDKGFTFLKDYKVIKGFMDSYGLIS